MKNRNLIDKFKELYKKKPFPRRVAFADFETTNINKRDLQREIGAVEVYLWSFFTAWDGKLYTGTNLMDFIKLCFTFNFNVDIWFHNGSKFDFHFLIHIFKCKDKKDNFIFNQVFQKNKNIIENLLDSDYRKDNIKNDWNLKSFEYQLTTDKNKKIYEIKLGLPTSHVRRGKHIANCLTFRDSNLLFPSSLKQYGKTLSKALKIDIQKDNFKGYLDIFYVCENLETFRTKITNAETHIEYVKKDTLILALFLLYISHKFKYNAWKMTQAGTSYNEFMRMSVLKGNKKGWLSRCQINPLEYVKLSKRSTQSIVKVRQGVKLITPAKMGKKLFANLFPTDWIGQKNKDDFYPFDLLRNFYSGGLVYVNPHYQGIKFKKKHGVKGTLIDINSSYPYAMTKVDLPYGNPVKNGKYKLIKITSTKKMENLEGLPFLFKIIKSNTVYMRTIEKDETYFVDSNEMPFVLKYYGTHWKSEIIFSFNTIKGERVFGEYVNHWINIKNQASLKNDAGSRIIAKLFLNSLYGKFGEKNHRETKIFNPNLFENWEDIEAIEKPTKYLPIAIAITKTARMRLVSAVGNRFKDFIYCDTDSLFLRNFEKFQIKTGNGLGEWKIEQDNVYDFIFRHRKQYRIQNETKTKTALAGFTVADNEITWKSLIYGGLLKNQLRPSRNVKNFGRFLEKFNKKILPVWDNTFIIDKELWFNSKESYYKQYHSQRVKLSTS